MKNIMLHYLSY